MNTSPEHENLYLGACIVIKVSSQLVPDESRFYLQPTEPSSTQSEVSAGPGQGGGPEGLSEREVPCGSQEEASDMDQSEQQAPAGVLESPEASSENSDPVSSSGSSSHFEETASEEAVPSPSSSTPETPTEGAMESGNVDTGTSDEPMEQD